jgi:hypothetical protein
MESEIPSSPYSTRELQSRHPGEPVTRLTTALITLLLLAPSGCGYRVLTREALAPGGVSRLSVPLLVNETEHVGVESDLTGHLVDALDRYRGVAVTDGAPDAVLEGTIRQAGLRPTTSLGGTTLRHQAFRVSLVLDLRLRRVGSDEVIWQVSGLRREEDYDMGPVITGEDILAAEQLRRSALVGAGRRLVEEGVELMMGGS